MELNIIDNKGKESGKVNFDQALVSTKASKTLVHEVITAYLANQRLGTHSTLTRKEVSGGGAKPWKQKGTGRARSGSTRSPLWRHGGIIFGPKPRDYRQDIPKQKKKLAFQMAIGSLVEENKIQVVDPVVVKEPKTKKIAEIYAKWKAPSDSLYVIEKIDPTFHLASRNIENVHVTTVESLNTYECLKARKVFITPSALEQLALRIGKKEA